LECGEQRRFGFSFGVRRFLRRFCFSFGLLINKDKTKNQSGEGIAALQTKSQSGVARRTPNRDFMDCDAGTSVLFDPVYQAYLAAAGRFLTQ